jgi:hypothetical protein
VNRLGSGRGFGVASFTFAFVHRSKRSPKKPEKKPVSGFGCLLIVLDSCEGAAMARSISTGVFTFHEPGFEGGIVGDEAIERAHTKQH